MFKIIFKLIISIHSLIEKKISNFSLSWTSSKFKEELDADPELKAADEVLKNTDWRNPKHREERKKAVNVFRKKGYRHLD